MDRRILILGLGMRNNAIWCIDTQWQVSVLSLHTKSVGEALLYVLNDGENMTLQCGFLFDHVDPFNQLHATSMTYIYIYS